MTLGLLADDESIHCEAAGGCGVQHGSRHWVGSHGEPTNSVNFSGAEALLFQPVQQLMTDERRSLVMEGGTTHIDVVVRFLAGS